MKKRVFISVVILSVLAVACAPAKDNRLEKILKRYPAEVIEDFYQNGMLKAEKYDSSQITFAQEKNTSEEFLISPLPDCDTQHANECGGMSSAYVMRFFGEKVTGAEIYSQIEGKNADGTISPKPLKNYWDKKTDYEIKVFKGNIEDLKDAVSHNVPVIVLINCKGGWHYVPVVGFDKKNFYIQDSVADFRNERRKSYNRKESFKNFEKLWDVVLPESDHLMFIIQKK